MSRFTQELILRPAGDKDWQVLNVDLVWEVRDHDHHHPSEKYGIECEVHIPYGFVTDLASVPRFLWPIIASFGTHSTAAVLHDYLYRHASKHEWSRLWCDHQFYDSMIALGTRPFRAKIMYRAVRLFGVRAFQRKSR